MTWIVGMHSLYTMLEYCEICREQIAPVIRRNKVIRRFNLLDNNFFGVLKKVLKILKFIMNLKQTAPHLPN